MRLQVILGALALGSFAVPGAAETFTVDGITITSGAKFATVTIFDGERKGGPVMEPGQELIGIGYVNALIDAETNVVLWSHLDNGREMTIYFEGYVAEDFDTANIGGSNFDFISFSGGTLRIYVDDSPDFSASTGSIEGDVATATDGRLWLELKASATGGAGGFTGAPVTMRSVATRGAGDPFSYATSVSGTGLLDVSGGNMHDYFDTDTFGCVEGDGHHCPDSADKLFASIGVVSPVGGVWAFQGTGDVRDFVIVPEGGLPEEAQ